MAEITRQEFVAHLRKGADLDRTQAMMVKDENLRGLDLSSLDLRRVYFTNCNLEMAKLDRSAFSDSLCVFEDCDLSDTSFVEAILKKTYLGGGNFSRANFSRANMRYARGSGVILDGANLSETDLCGTDFGQKKGGWLNEAQEPASMKGAILRGSRCYSGLTVMDVTYWVGVDLSGAHLKGVDFSKSDLQRCDFSGATIEDTIFTGTDLRWANFEGATLRNVNMRGAYLNGANFNDAKLVKFDIKGAQCNLQTIWPDPDFRPEVFGAECSK